MSNNLQNQFIDESFQKLVQVSGSVLLDGTGSLLNITSVSASHALNADQADTADVANTANAVAWSNVVSKPVGLVSSSAQISTITGSLIETASAVASTITFTKGDGSQFDVVVSQSGSVESASYATFAATAGEVAFGDVTSKPALVSGSGQITLSDTIGYSTFSSSIATGISTNKTDIDALNAKTLISGSSQVTLNDTTGDLDATRINGTVATATSSSHALKADTSDTATSASYVTGQENYARKDQDNVFIGNQTFNNITVNGTGSFAYLQQVTGSVKKIGDAFIQLNTDTPAQRYGGIKIIDSGSANVTASFQWDGEKDIWMQVEADGTSAGFLTGLSGSLGTEAFPTNNYILKGTGGHQVVDSSITDDGSTVTVNGDLNVTGDFLGTIVSASHALNADNAIASQTATSASHAIIADSSLSSNTATSASHAVNSDTSIVAVNLTSGDKSHTGVITQTFNAPAVNNEEAFYNVNNVSIAGKSYDRVFYGFADYSGFGSDFEDYFAIEYYDGFGYNYGSEFNLNGKSAKIIAVPSGSGFGQRAYIQAQDTFTGTSQADVQGNIVKVGTLNSTDITIGKSGAQLDITGNTTITGSLDVTGAVTIEGNATFNSRVQGGVTAISIASNTGSLDVSQGNFFTITLQNGIDTHLDASNIVAGQTISVRVKNNATAAGTLSFSSDFKFADGTAPTVTATTNAEDILTFISFDGTSLYGTSVLNLS